MLLVGEVVWVLGVDGGEEGVGVVGGEDKGMMEEVKKIRRVREMKLEGKKEVIEIVGKEIEEE